MTWIVVWGSGVVVGTLLGAGVMAAVWHRYEQHWRRLYARQLGDRGL